MRDCVEVGPCVSNAGSPLVVDVVEVVGWMGDVASHCRRDVTRSIRRLVVRQLLPNRWISSNGWEISYTIIMTK